ncbi:hypothetical protein C8F01DRAFT_1148198 [Mycena amicta]|nr:hypothetical protein C8F01DRAFT_1148198 [Mycena amicta]
MPSNSQYASQAAGPSPLSESAASVPCYPFATNLSNPSHAAGPCPCSSPLVSSSATAMHSSVIVVCCRTASRLIYSDPFQDVLHATASKTSENDTHSTFSFEACDLLPQDPPSSHCGLGIMILFTDQQSQEQHRFISPFIGRRAAPAPEPVHSMPVEFNPYAPASHPDVPWHSSTSSATDVFYTPLTTPSIVATRIRTVAFTSPLLAPSALRAHTTANTVGRRHLRFTNAARRFLHRVFALPKSMRGSAGALYSLQNRDIEWAAVDVPSRTALGIWRGKTERRAFIH